MAWPLARTVVATQHRVRRVNHVRCSVPNVLGLSALMLFAGCRNTESCCGLEVGEVYDIEFMTEIAVDRPEVFTCSDVGLQSAGSVGDTLRIEVAKLKYYEQLDCSDVTMVRLIAATPERFQFLVGHELENGFFADIDGRYRRILGGDVDPPAGETGRWRMGLQSDSCDGVDGSFNAERPELIFGVLRNTSDDLCAEAWGVRLTRVHEDE